MEWINEYGITLSVDAEGHKHKGKGKDGGQFTSSDSDASRDKLATSFVDNVSVLIRDKSPSAQTRLEEVLRQTVSGMPSKALSILSDNLKGVELFKDSKQMINVLSKRSDGFRLSMSLSHVKEAAGFFDPITSFVHITSDEGYDSYLHEFAHAIDHHGIYTKTKEWIECWEKELKSGKLCNYAATLPEEGFAELCRYLYDPQMNKKLLQKDFPKCTALLKKWGLL